jgi:lysophospholipase L1-like esterase
LKQIVRHLVAAVGARRVLVVAPPPVHEPARLAHVLATYNVALEQPERTNEAAGRYAAAALAAAAEAGVPSLDLWSRLQEEEAGWEERLLSDGLHLSPAGNARVGELVLEAVVKAWPELAAEALPMDAPTWDELAAVGDPAAAVAAHVAAAGAARAAAEAARAPPAA